jgi:hypothetical protein
MSVTPQERSERARAAAHAKHSHADPREATAAARAARWEKYQHLADHESALAPDERERRAHHLLRADLARARLAGLRRQRESREAAAAAVLAEELVEVAQ